MYRIDNITAAATLPLPAAAGIPGFFTGGNPATGTAATILDADWLNALQEEVVAVITGFGGTLSKTNRGQLFAALQGISIGRLLNLQMFTVPGTSTYTMTSGTNSVEVTVVGGGGAGGGTAATGSGQLALANPGNAGAIGIGRITSGFNGAIVTVGAAGVGGAAGANAGSAGGTSSFGALISAPGGAGGQGGIATNGYSNPACFLGAPAVGGSILNIPGNAGTVGLLAVPDNGIIFSGAGGQGPYGAAGPGLAAPSNGSPGAGFGVGGAGAAATGNYGALVGGNGTPGLIIIREFS